MAGYEPINLSGLCNASLERLNGRLPPVGEQMFHGLPVHRAADHVIVAHRRLAGEDREFEADIRVDRHCWLAARCGGPDYWDSPSHLGPWPLGIFARTSPVYVPCGGEWSQFDAEHARTMLALIEGGLQRVRRVAVRYPEDRVSHQHGEADHSAYLERPFLEARKRVRERLDEARSAAEGE